MRLDGRFPPCTSCGRDANLNSFLFYDVIIIICESALSLSRSKTGEIVSASVNCCCWWSQSDSIASQDRTLDYGSIFVWPVHFALVRVSEKYNLEPQRLLLSYVQVCLLNLTSLSSCRQAHPQQQASAGLADHLPSVRQFEWTLPTQKRTATWIARRLAAPPRRTPATQTERACGDGPFKLWKSRTKTGSVFLYRRTN